MADMRLIVAGAGGRMGRTLVKAIAETKGLVLAGAVEDAGSPLIGQDAGVLAGLPANGIKLSADAKALLAERRRHHRLHRAEGEHGLCRADRPARCTSSAPPGTRRDEEARIRESAKSAVIVKSGNMSLGVNLLAALTKRVAKTLDDSFDIEIFEMHHNKKIDAPSGTALMFGRAAAEGRGIDLAKHSARGRDGETGARKAGDIGFASACAAAPWSASTA